MCVVVVTPIKVMLVIDGNSQNVMLDNSLGLNNSQESRSFRISLFGEGFPCSYCN